MFTATLVAEGLAAGDLSAARDRLAAKGCAPAAPRWIETGEAADLPFAARPERAREVLEGERWDVVVQPVAGRGKRLLVADMDSTMIGCECIDELADYAGVKAEVAAVTERAMRGELDFAGALDARVRLLAGLEEAAIDRCLAERVRATPCAEVLVRTMRARGATTLLVSGGFTRFAEPVGAMLGFERVVANRLAIAGGRLTGTVERPIVDRDAKRMLLEQVREEQALECSETLAVGDGANDLGMIGAAGLGAAYRAKPVVAAAADARIERGDLSVLLYAQGIARTDWVGGRA